MAIHRPRTQHKLHFATTPRQAAIFTRQWRRRHAFFFVVLLLVCLSLAASPAWAQGSPEATPTPAVDDAPLDPPESIDVQPTVRDDQIQQRLQDILDATGWFDNPVVAVSDGVVFLTGATNSEEFKQWAGDLARNTQDVAAVINQITIVEPSAWDFGPALSGLREQARVIIRSLPLIGFSLLILLVAVGLAWLSIKGAHRILQRRVENMLLANVIARSVGLVVFLFGLYVVFQIVGLTGAALTVIGGTGLLGLILGIAFRDITENFLASIFLSVQTPFRSGDFVEIDSVSGFVQMMTTRATVMMTIEGNHVQIPNAIVYKSKIFNYTSNPNRRMDFVVGIGYDDNISTAQEIILAVLAQHEAILNDPEPSVLVESLGSATINLRIYFWLDASRHSLIKVQSAVIRLVKRALQDAHISMPDEAREVVFPTGVTVQLMEPSTNGAAVAATPPVSAEKPELPSTLAEGGLTSEAKTINAQARQSRTPEEGENLLKNGSESAHTKQE